MTFPQFDPGLSLEDKLVLAHVLEELTKPELNLDELSRCVEELHKRHLITDEQYADLEKLLLEARDAAHAEKARAELAKKLSGLVAEKLPPERGAVESGPGIEAYLVADNSKRHVFQEEVSRGLDPAAAVDFSPTDPAEIRTVEQACAEVGEGIREREEREDAAAERERADEEARKEVIKDLRRVHPELEALEDIIDIQETEVGGPPSLFKLELQAMDLGVDPQKKRRANAA